ncbi:MAG: MarR family transcriptional regulator [Gammaproteobacteria bacterium]
MNDYDEILVSLRKITRAIDLHSRRVLKTSGLTTSQLLVLQSIDRLGNPSPSAIAREVVLSQATVSSLLDRLSNHGLILRVRAEGDRRQMLVQLTDLGRERLATSPSPLQEEFLGKFRNLPTWEQHMLIASMQKIAEMMNAENLDASPILAVGEIGQGAVDTANATSNPG